MIPAWHMLKFHLLPAIAVAGLGVLLLKSKNLSDFLKDKKPASKSN